MVHVKEIKPLTDFLRNSKAHIERLKSSGSPELLTVNGEASVIVQDAESYEKMAVLAEEARQDARLRESLHALKNNEPGISAEEAFRKLRSTYFLNEK